MFFHFVVFLVIDLSANVGNMLLGMILKQLILENVFVVFSPHLINIFALVYNFTK